MANPALDQIREELKHPLPTAVVGWTVNWYEANETDRCYAARVTAVEGPGRVALIIFKPDARPLHKRGVLHRSHPILQNRHAVETMRGGGWDYLPDTKTPMSHFDLHRNQLKQREQAMAAQEEINSEMAKKGFSERAVT